MSDVDVHPWKGGVSVTARLQWYNTPHPQPQPYEYDVQCKIVWQYGQSLSLIEIQKWV